MYDEMAADAKRPLHERIELWQQARRWYGRELEQIKLMKQRKLLAQADADVAEERRARLARCDAAIVELTAAAVQPGPG